MNTTLRAGTLNEKILEAYFIIDENDKLALRVRFISQWPRWATVITNFIVTTPRLKVEITSKEAAPLGRSMITYNVNILSYRSTPLHGMYLDKVRIWIFGEFHREVFVIDPEFRLLPRVGDKIFYRYRGDPFCIERIDGYETDSCRALIRPHFYKTVYEEYL